VLLGIALSEKLSHLPPETAIKIGFCKGPEPDSSFHGEKGGVGWIIESPAACDKPAMRGKSLLFPR